MVIPIKFGININTKVFYRTNLRDCFAIIDILSLALVNIGFVVISIEYGSALICFCNLNENTNSVLQITQFLISIFINKHIFFVISSRKLQTQFPALNEDVIQMILEPRNSIGLLSISLGV